jgi:hypothetical protein
MTLTPQRSAGTPRQGEAVEPTGAGGPRVPGRLPGPRSDRRPALAALAVLLVLGGALVSGLVAYRSGQRSDFLVLTRDVAPGQRITADDLGVARIAGTGARAVPAARRDQVVGEYATVGAFAGTLLTPDMVEPDRAVPPGSAVVGLALDAGQAPAGGVQVGDVVRILSVPARGAQERSAVLVDAARVSAVSGREEDVGGVPGGGSSATVVSVVVPVERSAQVAAASTQRQAAIVLLPPATTPTVER